MQDVTGKKEGRKVFVLNGSNIIALPSVLLYYG
jgi:hypothetical protein